MKTIRYQVIPLVFVVLLLPGCSDSIDNELFHACIRATACDVRAYPRVADCLFHYKTLAPTISEVEPYDRIYACTNRAETCNDVKDCFGITSSCDRDFTAFCNGGQAVFCDLTYHTTFKYDCSGIGCAVDKANTFGANCTGGTTKTNMSTDLDCSDGSCTESGEACHKDKFDVCDGAKLRSCIDGSWVDFDCAALGLGPCVPDSLGAACGLPAPSL